MPVKAADQKIRIAVVDILSKFLRKDNAYNRFRTLIDKVYKYYMLYDVGGSKLNGVLNGSDDLYLRDRRQFIFLEPILDSEILPFLTLQTSDRWLHFRAYVLLAMLDEDEQLKTLAIRFETDEGERQTNGTIGSHDFCHAQLCRSIGVLRASTPSWLPESQPSFPLDAKDQVGLVLCMLTSLYGGRHVVARLNTNGGRDLCKHLKKVRALAPN